MGKQSDLYIKMLNAQLRGLEAAVSDYERAKAEFNSVLDIETPHLRVAQELLYTKFDKSVEKPMKDSKYKKNQKLLDVVYVMDKKKLKTLNHLIGKVKDLQSATLKILNQFEKYVEEKSKTKNLLRKKSVKSSRKFIAEMRTFLNSIPKLDKYRPPRALPQM